MWKLDSVTPSERESKKYKAVFKDSDTGKTKTVHFGARGMEDYTEHHDKERRARYLERHKKDLRTEDPTKPGYLSFYISWGESTDIKRNITKYKKLFNL